MESAAGTAPGRTGKSVGTAAPAAGTASGRTGKSVGAAAPAARTASGEAGKSVGSAQVLLMNELQERRRCRKC